jgi:hypothetical protein
MYKKNRTALSLLFAAATFGGVPGVAFAQDDKPVETAPAEDTALKYSIVTTEGARILNVADKNGAMLCTASLGQVLIVQGKKRGVGFLPVEAPGGYPVWVHGRNLRATDAEDVLEITANAVNQRPMSSSGPESYPLSLRLHAGDLVRMIERKDASKKLAEDWVRVWSAPGSTGWILATDLKSVKEGGAKLWTDAMAELGTRTTLNMPKVKSDGADANGVDAKTAMATRESEAEALFGKAEALLASERIKAVPDFSSVKATFEAVVALDAGARWERDAKSGLLIVAALEEAVALKSDLEAEKILRLEELLGRQRRIWEEGRKADPMIGKFDARGVLERRSRFGEGHRYVLRWGPNEVCEVRCASGKYDLDIFAGYELGLKGLLEYAKPGALLEEKPVLEVGQIEVLSKR